MKFDISGKGVDFLGIGESWDLDPVIVSDGTFKIESEEIFEMCQIVKTMFGRALKDSE